MRLLLALLAFASIASCQVGFRCVQFSRGACVRCSSGGYLWGGLCYPAIEGCEEYSDPKECLKCGEHFKLEQGRCLIEVKGEVTLYHLAYPINVYLPLDLDRASNDPLFVRCDAFIRSGQYKHFISRGMRPFLFVGLTVRHEWHSYKIIYEGSGGGLLMCIVEIGQFSSAVLIRALVTIGSTQLVEHCLDYSLESECSVCREGYHLENGVCYQDIEGCVAYFGHICVRCDKHSLLIENMCISACASICDTRKIQTHVWPLK